jgi:hypothetical protein
VLRPVGEATASAAISPRPARASSFIEASLRWLL